MLASGRHGQLFVVGTAPPHRHCRHPSFRRPLGHGAAVLGSQVVARVVSSLQRVRATASSPSLPRRRRNHPRARGVPHFRTWRVGRAGFGPQLAVARVLWTGCTEPRNSSVPQNKYNYKMQRTLKLYRKINTAQKNTKCIWKCSAKQTLSNGVIFNTN